MTDRILSHIHFVGSALALGVVDRGFEPRSNQPDYLRVFVGSESE
jgi:hypothetical protein